MSEESSQDQQQPKEPLNVYDLVTMMVDQFAAVSWQKLGLQHDLLTGQIAPDMAQAKVAIDLTAHMAAVLEPQLDETDRRRLQALITDLRLNYVQKSQGGEA